MISTDELNLWYENNLVGYVWRNDLDRIGFRYDPDWLHNDCCFPVSLQLPITEDEFSPDEGKAHRFFANLLPEGQARINIVSNLKIANSDFELLREIGGECAGALSLLPITGEPKQKHAYQELTEDKLCELIKGRGKIYYFRENKKMTTRLSLAGAQNKCGVFLNDKKILLPIDEAPSSHILKFQIADLRHVPAYETFLTHLAKQIGLPTVEVELRSLTGIPADKPDNTFIIIKRYDRIEDENGKIRRLHQEDFCQALGYGHEKKYQEKGGPSFSDCMNLIRDYSDEPAIDIENLLRWKIFNLLAGNSDGHAKNLSLLYRDTYSRRLAPFYDLVCTRAIEHIDTSLAFNIGGKTKPGDINKDAWITLSKKCDLRSQYVLKTIKELAEKILASLPDTINNFQDTYGEYKALQRVEQLIVKQCKRTLKDLLT